MSGNKEKKWASTIGKEHLEESSKERFSTGAINRMPPLECLDDVRELKSALAHSKTNKDRLFTFSLGLIASLDCLVYVVVNYNINSDLQQDKKKHQQQDQENHHDESKCVVLLSYLKRSLLFWKRKADLVFEDEGSDSAIFLNNAVLRIQNIVSWAFVILWMLEAIRVAYHEYWKQTCKRTSFHPRFCYKKDRTIISYCSSPTGVALGVLLLRVAPLWIDIFLQRASHVGHLGLEHAKQSLFGILKYIAKHIAMFAFYHPLYFQQRMAVTINVIRWLRYILPILSSFNKIWSNFKKFLIVYRQHRAAMLARRVKRRLWGQMTPGERAEKAALRIQCVFRQCQASKYVKSLPVNNSSEISSAILIQRAFRRCLLCNRSKIRLKGEKLREFCKRTPNLLASNDVVKRHELELELKQELKEKKNNLLLIRPNSVFSTVWKAIVLVVILLDMVPHDYFGNKGKHVLKPNKHTNILSWDINDWFGSVLKKSHEEKQFCEMKNSSRGISRWFNVFAFYKNLEVMNHSKKNRPWYCSRAFVVIQESPLTLATVVINKMPVFVGIVLLSDVFVTFFTGDFNHVGILVPQPFFKRWILGLGLKLLTNPLAKPITTFLFHFIMDVGPGRVTYWYLAVFGPISEYIFFTNSWFTVFQAIKNS